MHLKAFFSPIDFVSAIGAENNLMTSHLFGRQSYNKNTSYSFYLFIGLSYTT